MKEDVTDKIKYNHVSWELQELLDNKFGKYRYWVEGSAFRHIGIHRYIPLFSLFLPLVANVYAKDDDEGYGEVTVYSKKVYVVLKEWAESKGYSDFKSNFKIINL